MNPIVQLIVGVLLLALLWWVVIALGLPAPIPMIVLILGIIVLIGYVFGGGFSWRR